MKSKAFLSPALLFAIVLLIISSEVAARQLADETKTSDNKTNEATAESKGVTEAEYGGYPGGGYGGGYPGRGGYGGGQGGDGRGGYGGGYCRRCCGGYNYNGRCRRCCYEAEGVNAEETQVKPHN